MRGNGERFKWVCLVLTAIIILLAVYQIKDEVYYKMNEKLATERQIAFNLATSLSQVNKLLTPGSQVFLQINNVLIANGYADLVVQLPETEAIIPDSLNAGKEK